MDKTGYMGAAQAERYGPQKCYNAQNHWTLGWFDDRAIKLDTFTRPRILQLAAFVDYPLTYEREFVVINIADQHFVQFNRAKDHNTGPGYMENQVTIVSGDVSSGTTDLVVGLDMESSEYRFPNFQDTQSDLVIDVCYMRLENDSDGKTKHSLATKRRKPDKVILSIALDRSMCKHIGF